MSLLNKLFSKINPDHPQTSTGINRDILLKNAKKLGTDLAEADYFKGCCEECAKYRGRWFSISGKDKRFPKMPADYPCRCSGISFSPVIYGISVPTHCNRSTDIIKFSNRPFVDDRTKEEKKTFEIYLKETENEKFFAPYQSRWDAIKQYDKTQYERLLSVLPDLAPKSFSGYMKMKNGNTKNYQKLLLEADKVNIVLDYTEEMKREIEVLTPIREQYEKIKAECIQYHNSHK
jgi:hypothetical protein